MWLLLVTTVASVVVAEAGYLYNVPHAPLGLPRHHHASAQQVHLPQAQNVRIASSHDEDKSITYSISYKDYVYLKKDEGNHLHSHQFTPNYNNLHAHSYTGHAQNNAGILTSQNSQASLGGISQALLPPVNYNNHYAAPYPPNTQSHQVVTSAADTGHIQTSPLPAYNNLNTGYVQSAAAHGNANYNNGYSQITAPPAPVSNLNYAYPPHSASAVASNLHTGTVHSAASNGGYSHGYVQQPSSNGYNHVTASAHSGYSQAAKPSSILNNGYNQAPVASTSLNSGYQHAGHVEHNSQAQVSAPIINGYSQSAQATSSVNNGYYATPVNTQINNGYSQPSNNVNYSQGPQASAQLNNGYSQAQATSVANNAYSQVSQTSAPLHNVYNQNAQVSNSINNGYSQVAQPAAPLHNGYSQVAQATATVNNGYNPITQTTAPGYSSSASASASTSLNNGYVQTSASSSSVSINNGYSQPVTSGIINLNTDFTPILSSNVNNPVEPTPISTASSSAGGAFAQASTGPIHVDLNSGLAQSSASSDVASDINLTQNILTTAQSSLTSNVVQNNLNVALNPSPATITPAPIIHKHIYFHVPPPEIEEPPKPTPSPPPPKKNYKILFIKVPSQDSKSNLIRLQQQIAERQKAAVEEKTLIYVLVKNPEDPKPVELPKPKPSEHQVYFVKYNGSPFDIASQVNDELDKTGSVKSIVPLEPGLVNGQQK